MLLTKPTLMQNLLSICIPTYNRAYTLKTNLVKHLEITKYLGIEYIVSNNNSSDNTDEIMQQLRVKCHPVSSTKRLFTTRKGSLHKITRTEKSAFL